MIPRSDEPSGNALESSPGQAADVLPAVMREVGDTTHLFTSCRILADGADNDEVCACSPFHHPVAGEETRL